MQDTVITMGRLFIRKNDESAWKKMRHGQNYLHESRSELINAKVELCKQ